MGHGHQEKKQRMQHGYADPTRVVRDGFGHVPRHSVQRIGVTPNRCLMKHPV